MKIYPSKHEILSTKKIDKNFDIPLAYVDSNFSDIKVNIKCQEQDYDKRIILPYDSFDNLDILFFNEYGEEIKTIDVLRRNDRTKKYFYIPKHSITYNPQRFNYQILAEKSLVYSSSDLYNINVICTDLDFTKHIIQIFGDAPKRHMCPSNIYINNQEKIPMKFLNDSIKGDIAFIVSEDGVHYKGTTTKINFEEYLNKHVNVWLVTDYIENQNFINDNFSTECTIKNPIIYNSYKSSTFKQVLNNDTITDSNLYSMFNNQKIVNIFDGQTYPIGLIKVNKKGYIAISNNSIFNSIEDNTNLIYETIMYIYCNSYIKSNPINTWIADEMPDYVVENGKAIKKERLENPIDVSKIFSIPKSQINICDIIPDAPNILIDDITDDFVVFKKNMDSRYDNYKDGFHKPLGSKTIFTLRQDIICYQDFVYLFVDSLKNKISYIVKNNKVYLKIAPFKDSLNGINIDEPVFLELPLFKIKNYKETKVNEITYYLYCKDNVLNVVESNLYLNNKHGNILSEIKIEKEKINPNIFDIRQRGGGSDDKEENFDLLDVGNALGRPYRKAGAIIVTLPLRYKKYKDIINNTIEKHKVGEEYFIVLFED